MSSIVAESVIDGRGGIALVIAVVSLRRPRCWLCVHDEANKLRMSTLSLPIETEELSEIEIPFQIRPGSPHERSRLSNDRFLKS